MNKALRALCAFTLLIFCGSRARAVEAPLSLSLSEAIRTAVEKNLEVRAELYNPAQLEAEINRNLAIYDPTLSAQAGFIEARTPSTTRIGPDPNEEQTWQLNSSLSQLFHTGATASVIFNNNYVSNNLVSTNPLFNSSNPLLNDYWQSNLGVRMTQPLLRNFGRENTEAAINISRLSKSASMERFNSLLLTTVAQVRREYYTLYNQREQWEVRKGSLELARKILAETKARVKAGVLPAMEISNADFGVAAREKDLLDAEKLVNDQEDVLRLLLQLTTTQPIHIVDRPWQKPLEINTDEAIKQALRTPNIKEQKHHLEISRLQSRVFNNKTKPDLSLTASNSLEGLGQNYDRNLKRVGAIDYPTWTVGLDFSYPLGNGAAENDYRRSQLKTEQTALQIRSLEESMTTAVKAAIRGISTGYKQLEVTARGRAYAEERLQAFIRKNEVGLATTKEVLEVENDLATAKSSEITAAVNYDQAITRLYELTGELLERDRIKVDEAAANELYLKTTP